LVLAPLPYILLYSVREDSVNLLRILHGAQEWQGESA
jgi:plasmid stabilization system protein ParE